VRHCNAALPITALVISEEQDCDMNRAGSSRGVGAERHQEQTSASRHKQPLRIISAEWPLSGAERTSKDL
jgi:hypothetical protein